MIIIMIMRNVFKTLVLLSSVVLLVSCGPSEEEIIKGAEQATQGFVDELNMQNFNSATEIYPNFRSVTRYNILNNFRIKSAKFATNSESEIRIIGDYNSNGNYRSVQFVINYNENDEAYHIIKSKGLSSYYESDVFNILKRSGCLTDIESDARIHEDCLIFEPKYNAIIDNIRQNIENQIVFEKRGSNLTNNYDVSVSGELMLKNNTNITIPAYAYDIYILLYDGYQNLVHSSKYQFNNKPILGNSYHQVTVFSMDYQSSFKSYLATVKITNDQFIRDYVANNETIDCSAMMGH